MTEDQRTEDTRSIKRQNFLLQPPPIIMAAISIVVFPGREQAGKIFYEGNASWIGKNLQNDLNPIMQLF